MMWKLFSVKFLFLLLILSGGDLFAQKTPISVIKEKVQVGGADVVVRPMKGAGRARCDLSNVGGRYRIHFNTLGGEACRIKIPLKKENLEGFAVLALRIRGKKDVQHFKIGMEADDEIEYVGAIFEYLPASVISSWSQMGIALREFRAKGLKLSRAQNLVFDFNEPAEGSIEIKDIAFVKQKPNTQNWEPVVIQLPEYRLKRMSQFKTISLGHYGIEFGWKVGRVYKEAAKRSFASGNIVVSQLKSRVPAIQDSYTKIADFDSGIENSLGGFFNEFARAPSSASVTLTRKIFRGKGGRALQIDYQKKNKGFCGAWIHFFDFKKSPLERVYLNAKPYKYLSFLGSG